MARKPKEKAEQKRPEILRTIRLPNGDLYGPGEEEEFQEGLAEAAKAAKAEAKGREAKGLQSDEFDPDEEIKRLTKLGMIVNFVDPEDDDEAEDITHDQRSQRASVKALSEGRVRDARPGEQEEDDVATRVRTRNQARLESDERRTSVKAPKRKAKAEAADEGGGTE